MKVEIPTTQQINIVGELRQKHASKQLLIICSGLRTSPDHPAAKAITQKLFERGHAVFTFTFSDAHGMDVARQVADIEAIVTYFRAFMARSYIRA